jgi:predicted nuclease of predicted toxin-antitoxin system
MSPERTSFPPLLADVNIAKQVIEFLRSEGIDVASVYERGLAHLDDEAILKLATEEQRFVLTHDSDFGDLVIAQRKPFFGVLFLRPGDDPSPVVIEGLRHLVAFDCDWTAPLLATYRDGRLRLRRLETFMSPGHD